MAKKIKDEKGNTYVQKKPFYKRVWFWILVIIVIAGVGSQLGGDSSTKDSASSQDSSSSSSSSQKVEGVTKAAFDKVTLSDSTGTSSADVASLFGGKANSTSENTIQDVQTKVYTWDKVANGGFGSNVTVSFENEHAVAKAITGLKVDRSKKITLAQVEAIQNGTSKDDIQKEFGDPNGYDLTNIAGYTSEDWSYTSGVNGDAGANVIISFSGDTVSGKTQTNMK